MGVAVDQCERKVVAAELIRLAEESLRTARAYQALARQLARGEFVPPRREQPEQRRRPGSAPGSVARRNGHSN